ncbi:aconitase/3-isopropylmalate dehydratase large subunit family protein [Oleispirillum naphthae]|uniref:3-isopropylmalate dehydratase large subunit n=1 Tax=Oleispirillum naphthae TaxID=2838853 RepID=UPI0030822963
MGATIAEKILSRRAGRAVAPGDVVVIDADYAMANDGSGPMSIRLFDRLEMPVRHPERIVLVVDHYVPCPNDKVAGLLKEMADFAARHGIKLFRAGDGICHRLMPEQGYVRPGAVVVGADSHSTTYGALNAFAAGIGSSDFAGVLATGRLWLQAPASIRIELAGALGAGVYAKDLALHVVGEIGADGGTYRVLEYGGAGVASIDMEGRFTLCNMGVETGAKAAVMPCDAVTERWIRDNPHLEDAAAAGGVAADADAAYAGRLAVDLSRLEPMLAAPHRVDNVHPVADWQETAISSAVIGTCTNGSLEDMRIAAAILAPRGIASGVQLLVVPPSRQILAQAIAEGLISVFVEKGAVIVPPGCGPCCGALNGVPADGGVAVSTANRNFKGRMGNVNSEVFLASPATVAASAATGHITDPRRLSDV